MSSNYGDHGGDYAGNEHERQDFEYPPYDDNNYNNAITDRVYPWEDIGKFGNDRLSTSAEVMSFHDLLRSDLVLFSLFYLTYLYNIDIAGKWLINCLLTNKFNSVLI